MCPMVGFFIMAQQKTKLVQGPEAMRGQVRWQRRHAPDATSTSNVDLNTPNTDINSLAI